MNAPVPDPALTQPDPDGGVEMTDGEWAAFRGVEATSAMKAEDVPAELVEKAYQDGGLHGLAEDLNLGRYQTKQVCWCGESWLIDGHSDTPQPNLARHVVRHALAAVLPEVEAQALREAADLRHGTDLTPTTMSLGTDQGWWYEYLQRLDETWRANLRARAARLTTTTEEAK